MVAKSVPTSGILKPIYYFIGTTFLEFIIGYSLYVTMELSEERKVSLIGF